MKKNILFFLFAFLIIFFNCQQTGEDVVEKEKVVYINPSEWTSQTKIIGTGAVGGDRFGRTVSISGDYAIVGDDLENGSGTDRGACYIFYRTDLNTWDTGTKITAPDDADNDQFGYAVAISGNYAVIGASMEGGSGTDRGSVYIFYRTDLNSWDNVEKIIAPDGEDNDHFGASAAISGDYLIVGAAGEDGSGSNRGAAYVFHRTGLNIWDTGTKITAFDAVNDDQFGKSVSINGDYAIVGAPFKDNRGSVYIFRRTDLNSWDGGTKITASDIAVLDYFGYSVSISGDYAIVGSFCDDNGSDGDMGSAYIYYRTDTNSWGEERKITAPDGVDHDYFGTSVSLSGNCAIIGASSKAGGGISRGAGYIFNRTGLNEWDSGIKITASDSADQDLFGHSVSISGDYAVVGAYGKGFYGAAYIFNK